MTIGNWITIGMFLIGLLVAIKVKFNDLKHIEIDIREIKDSIKDLVKDTEQNAKDISYLKGKMNGG
jgi:hypothetical protein